MRAPANASMPASYIPKYITNTNTNKLITNTNFDYRFHKICVLYVLSLFLLHLGRGRNIAISLSVCLRVCVCLSVREHGPILTKFFVRIPCGRGSILLWRRCDMLCTSGFMDDVTFGRNWPYGDAWLAALRYR